MKKYTFKQVDAFTDRAFWWNPAWVILDARGLTDDEMLKIAVEVNTSETAFILPSHKADLRIRWFSPKTEVQFCGHATVATIHALAEEWMYWMEWEGKFGLTIEGLIWMIDITVIKKELNIKIILKSPDYSFQEWNKFLPNIFKFLKISVSDIDWDVWLWYEPLLEKLYIPMKSLDWLLRMKPDLAWLIEFWKENKIAGFMPFVVWETMSPWSHVHSRYFTRYVVWNEDSCTWSAQWPLGGYIIDKGLLNEKWESIDILSEQWDCMWRPGRVVVRVWKDKNWKLHSELEASAVTVITGEIFI